MPISCNFTARFLLLPRLNDFLEQFLPKPLYQQTPPTLLLTRSPLFIYFIFSISTLLDNSTATDRHLYLSLHSAIESAVVAAHKLQTKSLSPHNNSLVSLLAYLPLIIKCNPSHLNNPRKSPFQASY